MTSTSSQRSRTVIVTGGSAGVGRAIVTRFAEAGDRLGVIARDPAALRDFCEELQGRGAEVAVEVADVADAEAVFAAAQRLERKLGKIDIWINNAMETVFSRVADMTAQEFRRVTEVTYLGFVHGTMAALKSMRPRRQGSIIQISSALAYRGIPLQSAYCGAKHAIRGFTDALRTELIHEGSGVTITSIDLPAVNTPQFDWARAHLSRTPRPMGRPIQPEVVADAVFRAVGSRTREYWLGFPTALTVIGNTVLPAFLDRYLARYGIAGQKTGRLIGRERPDNLDRPVPGLHRTRGSFSSEARSSALLVPAQAAWVGMAAAAALGLLALGALLGSKQRVKVPRASPSS